MVITTSRVVPAQAFTTTRVAFLNGTVKVCVNESNDFVRRTILDYFLIVSSLQQ